ncbi:hypothetical protein BDV25DRAFT_150181 [Aspergillus avenaceus]|uniref:Uncharacterized protein n=1 Tax=Aspergillus avenaceus TaxID=36643 RepID=A0A5N6U2X9_ASPAV|nr:hypothetical protein BDV25DRAFT_150181 [Aspergillus avenaceus]
MAFTQHVTGITVVNYDVGNLANTPDNYTPDVAIFNADLPSITRPNHLPGDIKPSHSGQ